LKSHPPNLAKVDVNGRKKSGRVTDALLILLQALLVALHRGSEHGRAKRGLDTALTFANQPNVWLTRLSGKRQWPRGSSAE
jgi:hypothetical protein